VKNRTRSSKQIPCEEGLTVEEGLQLVTQLDQLVKYSQVVSYEAGESANQADLTRKKAQLRCSGCRETGQKINLCKNRYIQINNSFS
jgi:hypothetical protein